jgi:hypothetical protein
MSALQRAKVNLHRTTSNFARRHSRVSLIGASAAAAGVLGAAGFAVGAAPWAQALDNVAKTAQGDWPAASGQPGSNLFASLMGTKAADGKLLASSPFNAVIRSDATAGGTDVAASADHVTSQQQPTVTAAPYAPKHAAAVYAPKHAAKPQAAQHKVVPPKTAHPKTAHPKAVQAQAAKAAAKPKAAMHVAKHAAKPKAPAAPYLIYDSVKPSTLPAGKAAAVYVNGTFAAFPSQLSGLSAVLWIDTNGSDPAANVLDVEPGDATPARAAQWVKQRLSAQPHSTAIVYTFRNDWQQVKDNMATLPGWMQSKVRYWIADPTGVPHVVAGASATQWYWGNSYDVTIANPDFVN